MSAGSDSAIIGWPGCAPASSISSHLVFLTGFSLVFATSIFTGLHWYMVVVVWATLLLRARICGQDLSYDDIRHSSLSGLERNTEDRVNNTEVAAIYGDINHIEELEVEVETEDPGAEHRSLVTVPQICLRTNTDPGPNSGSPGADFNAQSSYLHCQYLALHFAVL